jgi:hypothetical protein
MRFGSSSDDYPKRRIPTAKTALKSRSNELPATAHARQLKEGMSDAAKGRVDEVR